MQFEAAGRFGSGSIDLEQMEMSRHRGVILVDGGRKCPI
jgi:hypothetical protein